MPKKKNYPKWFSPYMKPYAPSKPKEPSKTIKNYINVEVIENADSIPISKERLMNTDFDTLTVTSFAYEGDCAESTIYLQKLQDVSDPNYNKALKIHERVSKSYKEKYKEYREKLKEWKSLKAKWDEEVKKEKEAREKKQLERLKKKYENV